MLKRILVGLAGTPYTDVAIQRAVRLAQIHDAELTGVTIVDVHHLSHVGAAPIGAHSAGMELRDYRLNVAREHVQQFVEKFEEACQAADVRHRVLCEEGDAFKTMVHDARYHDLTIFGLRSVFEYFFEDVESGNLVARLVGGGVRPMLAESTNYRPIQHVLIAYNGSVGAARTLKCFSQLRIWPDANVRIATFDDAEGDAGQLLADAAEYCRMHGIDAETDRADGSAVDCLLPYADQWGADVIVMGNSGRNLLMRQLLGEATLHTIQHADRPLFLSQ